jgi:acetyl/propionyl-CoA carboxylase alpha subunit
MFRSLLVANRGEIALRVMRTARAWGCASSRSIRKPIATHATLAKPTLDLHRRSGSARFLPEHRIDHRCRRRDRRRGDSSGLRISRRERASSRRPCSTPVSSGIGPPPAAIRAMGDKGEAKRLMRDAGVPVLPTYAKETSSNIP